MAIKNTLYTENQISKQNLIERSKYSDEFHDVKTLYQVDNSKVDNAASNFVLEKVRSAFSPRLVKEPPNLRVLAPRTIPKMLDNRLDRV